MLAVLLLGLASPSLPHHVLFSHPLGSATHILQMAPLMEELLAGGNTVTAMLHTSATISHDNYTEILLPSHFPELAWEVNKVLDGKQMVEKTRNNSQGNVVINNLMDPSRWWRDYVMMDGLIDLAGAATVCQPVLDFLNSGVEVQAVVAVFPQVRHE